MVGAGLCSEVPATEVGTLCCGWTDTALRLAVCAALEDAPTSIRRRFSFPFPENSAGSSKRILSMSMSNAYMTAII